MAETFKDARETIQRLAADSFKEHALTEQGAGRWLCKRPGTGMYAFRVILAPGTVIVTGDIGDAIFTRISYRIQPDLLGWIRGSVDSPDYMLSKLAHQNEAYKQFYPDDAVAWANSEVGGSFMEDIDFLSRFGNLNLHTWATAVHENGVDDAYSIGTNWSSEALWLVEALRTFIRLHDQALELTPSDA